ncbi:hypothetical protein DFJ63DRAFT_206970 [Scheffersomyces coipomensis]|uniref:uncharacterized protein n=1 Tax=Scheffersomyces coipomensis TaxID=1788519 RepID=UPI00315D1930
MRIGVVLGEPYKPYELFRFCDHGIMLDRWPNILKNNLPRSLHIQGNIEEITNYLFENSNRINSIDDIKISLRIDLCPIPRARISIKKLLLEKLTLFQICFSLKKYSASAREVLVKFKIDTRDDLEELKKFSNKLGRPRSLFTIYECLPNTVTFMRLTNAKELPFFNNLNHLKSLSFIDVDIQYLKLPDSLENLTFSSSRFEDSVQEIRFSPNLKSIKIANTMYKHNQTFSNWPNTLKSLTMENNYGRDCIISDLPNSLEFLLISSLKSFNDINLNIEIFPESLLDLTLLKVVFPQEFNSEKIPQRLKRLELSIDLTSLSDWVLPDSLIHLNLDNNIIESITDYNNPNLNKDWQQLTHLRYLSLANNSITQSSIIDWLPPPTLNYLTLRANQINDLNISLFKEEGRIYTNNLLKIDVSLCPVTSIPDDFYFPENVYEFYLSGTNLQSRFLPFSIRSKRLTKIITRDTDYKLDK